MHETIEQLFIKKIQGECNAEEEQLFLVWLSESEENRDIFFQYKLLWHAGKVKTYSNDIFLHNAMENFNKRIDLIETKERKRKIFKVFRYAAILLALVCIPALFWYLRSDIKVAEKLLTETVGSHGEIKLISMADGTRMWLNNDSKVIYPEKFENNERTVQLEGEAFLEVKKDPEHPFIVKTKSVQIKVLGTSFNVNTKCKGDVIQTTLIEGSVMLLDEHGEKIAALKPGQMAAVESNSKKVSIKDVNTNNYVAWQSGVVTLEKASLNEIIDKIEEVYDIKIKLDSKLVTNDQIRKRYNFVFRRSQPVDTVFEMLKFLAPVNYVKRDNKSNQVN